MTKKPIAWVVDSTADVNDYLLSQPDVHIVPLYIHFGEDQFADGVDLTTEALYDRIRHSEVFPKTSQPPAGEFATLYTQLAEDYEAIIGVHVSGKLSGTILSSVSGAEIAGIPFEAVDSMSLSTGITKLVEYGISLEKSGLGYQEIAQKMRDYTANFRNYIVIGNLQQLYKGGRMSGLQFYIGSVLQIKPIVQITPEGELTALDKVRSIKKAMTYLVDRIVESYQKEDVREVNIMHGNNVSQAEEVKKLILEKAPDMTVSIGEISSVLAVHAGEGTLGALYYAPPKA
ncbi:DegV family protein [Paenisporosarcina cavernae]|uniref:DegV family protein n=1 Tax=Paenisporosarcina cavernae TaxID=2320858 RepID=A0A385YSW8_9BACL|nr:DegV family protein [Paenisporosarcina cavernae]AYC28742.1 DegV family protein [Paenisporosarcina cavernae]